MFGLNISVSILCMLVYSRCSVYGSVVIKSGVLEDQTQHKNLDHFGISSKLGATDFNEASGHNIEGAKKFSQAEDAGKYNQETGEKRLQSDAGKFADENFYKQDGGSALDTGKNVKYKKGHHKAGFHKSYNKDESSSESSFFDDGTDEGGQAYRNTFNGQYGDQAANEKHGSHLDDRRYENANANQAAYNKGDMYKKDYDDKKVYDTKKYYDGRENLEKAKLADVHALKGDKGYYEEKYVPVVPGPVPVAPHHPYDYVRPLPAEKTITIYEDPRVYKNDRVYDKGHLDRGNIRLDIRPPPPVVQYDDPSYDYYY